MSHRGSRPSLSYVCGRDLQLPAINQYLNMEGINKVCSVYMSTFIFR